MMRRRTACLFEVDVLTVACDEAPIGQVAPHADSGIATPPSPPPPAVGAADRVIEREKPRASSSP